MRYGGRQDVCCHDSVYVHDFSRRTIPAQQLKTWRVCWEEQAPRSQVKVHLVLVCNGCDA